MTNVAMVSGKLTDYLNAFLYSLALVAGIHVPQLDLNDKAAECAFRLADRWSGGASPGVKMAAQEAATAEDEEEDDGIQFVLEQRQETLPPDLIFFKQGGCSRQVGHQSVPGSSSSVAGLKRRAEENNHRGDSRFASDKFL